MARPMTMAEKILAAHAGLDEVEPGQLIECNLDLVLSNDITSPIAIKNFKQIGVEKVFDPTKIALVPDHYVPNKDIKSAEQAKQVRDFAREQGITHYYEVGCMGVEHALLPEQGVVGAGDLIIGADSHTCTYGALGAFSTGVGSTDAAVGYATGKAWFKVPESLLFKIDGQLAPGVTGKDVILYIIGIIWTAAPSALIPNTIPIPMPCTLTCTRSTPPISRQPWHGRICRPTRARRPNLVR